jgi:hypothetical protein
VEIPGQAAGSADDDVGRREGVLQHADHLCLLEGLRIADCGLRITEPINLVPPVALRGGGVFGVCEPPIAAPIANAPRMPAAIAALLLLRELFELRPNSKSARHPRSTQMPLRSNPQVRLRVHGAFDN